MRALQDTRLVSLSTAAEMWGVDRPSLRTAVTDLNLTPASRDPDGFALYEVRDLIAVVLDNHRLAKQAAAILAA